MQTIAGPFPTRGVAAVAPPPPVAPLTPRERFLRACRSLPVNYPPIWLMRQAGRALPEYRELKKDYSFLELVRTPELAAEVTLQPIRRFGFDAAILFSDILVVPEALGQGYRFRETGGVEMDFPITSRADIERLDTSAIAERLSYVTEAIHQIKPALGGKTALIGFAGSPWTLANFMVEGGSAKEPAQSLAWLRQEPAVLELLLEKLASAVLEFLRLQIKAGVEAVQIFDSHGGLLSPGEFRAGSGYWIAQIVRGLDNAVPVIVFSKGTRAWSDLEAIGADVIGVDHLIPMHEAIAHIPEGTAVQGNLDPGLLVGEPELVRTETARLLETMRGRHSWVFNLGHGLPPAANLESISALIETVRSFS